MKAMTTWHRYQIILWHPQHLPQYPLCMGVDVGDHVPVAKVGDHVPVAEPVGMEGLLKMLRRKTNILQEAREVPGAQIGPEVEVEVEEVGVEEVEA